MDEPLACWILTDGATGHTRQCQALAHYLPVEAEILRVTLRQPWEALAPHLRLAAGQALRGALANRLNGPWPHLVLSAGRRAALAALVVRQRCGGTARIVQLSHPHVDPGRFDLVTCPRHDQLTGENVISTLGALHAVDTDTLAAWRDTWSSCLSALPSPRVAVLVGGSNRAFRITADYLRGLAQAAERCAGDSGTLLLTTSRRTPPELQAALHRRFGPRAVRARDFRENPYRGFLAWADHLFVTPDSVNMVSEALGTGRPVYCTVPPTGNRRFRRFHEALEASGRVLPFEAAPATTGYEPLREARAVAARVARLLGVQPAGAPSP